MKRLEGHGRVALNGLRPVLSVPSQRLCPPAIAKTGYDVSREGEYAR